MSLTKTERRQQLQIDRLALPPDQRQAKSQAIVRRLQQALDWSTIKTIHYFEPIIHLGEVDISEFIAALQAENPAIQFFTSRQLDGNWKTFSLDQAQTSTPIQFDLILVPMLGFDSETLQRIGYGGGYYDRFLGTQPQAKKIGVCFELGKLDHIPAELHDVPLDVVITEVQSYS